MKVKKIGEIRVFNFDSCHKKKKEKNDSFRIYVFKYRGRSMYEL